MPSAARRPTARANPAGEPHMRRFTATLSTLALGAAGLIAASAGTAQA
ncbi:hypothetical protein AB0E10_39995 [Streptomyces sp. NPDC048045]